MEDLWVSSRKVTPYSLIREEINWKEQFSFNKGVVFPVDRGSGVLQHL